MHWTAEHAQKRNYSDIYRNHNEKKERGNENGVTKRMNWSGKRVLVTGAGGFIGSHLTERLAERGSRVGAFVRYNGRNDWGLLEFLSPDVLKNIKIMMGDLRDPEAVRGAVKDVDLVFHLGALISIPFSYLDPRNVVETNILGTLNVLNAVREFSIEKMIHTSSSEVYGTARYVPINERHPLQAQSPYSASKIAADKLVESYHLTYGLPLTTVRPFNTYGPRQSARAVIPTIISQALNGDEVHLGSLHPSRDLTFVSDTVDGILQAMESPGAIGEVINLGTGVEISIGELAEKIVGLMGKEVKVIYDESRVRPPKSEVERLVADNSKAGKLLGWQPAIDLEKGLIRTIEWVSQNVNRYKPGVYNV